MRKKMIAIVLAAALALSVPVYAAVSAEKSASMTSGSEEISSMVFETEGDAPAGQSAGASAGSGGDTASEGNAASAEAGNYSSDQMGQVIGSIESINKQMQELQQQNAELQSEVEKLSGGEDETEEEPFEATAPDGPTGNKVPMNENSFLADIKAANEGRLRVSSRYTGTEVAAMTNQEIAEMNASCVEEERNLYETYKDAEFSNKNLQYLCELYMKGLKNQFDAWDIWKNESDITKYNELWDAGYNKRALALVEIVDTYQVELSGMDSMRKTAEAMNEKDTTEAVTDQEGDAIVKAQNDLNTLGFQNEADGNYGKRTAQLLRRFEVMYGYSPADGVLNQAALDALEAEAAKVLPPETEAGTETETEG